MYVCVYVCKYVCVYVCRYVYMYVCIFTYIRIHGSLVLSLFILTFIQSYLSPTMTLVRSSPNVSGSSSCNAGKVARAGERLHNFIFVARVKREVGVIP